MADRSDIDLVAVVVKVPGHRRAVLAALEAGKHIYCASPLGMDSSEAQEMAELARRQGVITGVGLQGRYTPELNTMRALVAEGYVGEVFGVDMTWQTGGPPRGDDRSGVPGASMFGVGGGHTLDVVQHVVGPFTSPAQNEHLKSLEPGETSTTLRGISSRARVSGELRARPLTRD